MNPRFLSRLPSHGAGLLLAAALVTPVVAHAQSTTTNGTTTTTTTTTTSGTTGTTSTPGATAPVSNPSTPSNTGSTTGTTAPAGNTYGTGASMNGQTNNVSPTVITPSMVPPEPPRMLIVEGPPPPPPPPPEQVRLHDFLDTRLTWTFGDDDVLTSTGQRVPVSPLPRIGDRQQYQLFFDALNSRYAGRENLTHLAMYARAPGFIPNLVTEAALVLRFDLTQLSSGSGNLNQALYDAGSYLRIQYRTNPSRPNDGLSLTFFPFDTDRFRLGYLWDLSWGGNDVFPRKVGPAPGLRLGFDAGPFSAYIGFKTAGIVVPLNVVTASADIEVVRVEETQYGALAGAGYVIGDHARVDVSGGYFQQGRFDFPGVRGQQVFLYGGSARFVLNNHMPPRASIDMMLYRNDPNFPMQIFQNERYTPGQFSWMVSVEGTAMSQHLADIETPGATTDQAGFAGAIQARVKLGYLSAGATALYRDVPFILRNVPSFIPFYAIPKEATVKPEFFGAIDIGYYLPDAHITPSLIVGLQLPATFSTTLTEGALASERTLVIRRAGNFSILPPGEGALPIISSRLALRWDLSTIFAVIAWGQYVYDPNATLLDVDASGTRQVRVAQEPHQLGFGITAQARF